MDIDEPSQPTTGDPASSLRAAALLTLKSKRRKPTTEISTILPQRPLPPDPSFTLDYGQEDSPDVPMEEAPPPPSSTDDGQLREEGEISDTEGTPPPSKDSVRSTPPIDTNLNPPKPPTPIPRSPTPTPARPPRIESPIEEPQPVDDLQTPVPLQDSPMEALAPIEIPTIVPIVDENHVRPGLEMTQFQYDTAKDLILDLLGWGVAPEYLVDCGLTREIVFYVFTELNLRLPANLDISGLIPYAPGILVPIDTVTVRRTSMPPPPPPIITGSNPRAHPSLPAKPPLSKSSSSSQPQPQPQDSPTSATTSKPPTSASDNPSPSTPVVSASLHDMERQRRQELLARKAVQASRKLKTTLSTESLVDAGASASTSAISPTDPRDGDIEMAPPVPTETVDDFLNSIGPVAISAGASAGPAIESDNASEQTSAGDHTLVASPDAMEVDDSEAIPGLGTSDFPPSDPSPDASSAPANQRPPPLDASSFTEIRDPAPPLSGDSTTSTFEQASSSSQTLTQSQSQSQSQSQAFTTQSQSQVPPTQRRGTKRPVAADFVDFDGSGSGRGSHSNYITGGNPMTRRKTGMGMGMGMGYSNGNGNGNGYGNGGFASVSGMRRCVIDLSDSEGEGEGEGDRMYVDVERDRDRQREHEEYAYRERERSSRVGNGGGWSPGRYSASGSAAHTPGWATPPYLSTSAAPANNGMSPAALMEKEQEIKKMREMIAQREQNRLKKLAAMTMSMANAPDVATVSPPSTPNVSAAIPASLALATASVLVKQEEDDTIPLHTERPPIPDSNDTVSVVAGASATTPSIDERERKRERKNATNTMEHTSTGEQVLTAEARQEQVVSSTEPTDTHHLGQTTTTGIVDDQAATSSTQIRAHQRLEENLVDQARYDYAPYDSLFQWYPLLRSSNSPPVLSGDLDTPAHQASTSASVSASALYTYASSFFSSAFSSSSSLYSSSSTPSLSRSQSMSHLPFPLPNLRPLKLVTTMKLLEPHISQRICQYEIPGGGVCRDAGCTDVHLGRLGFGFDPRVAAAAKGVDPSDEDTAKYLSATLPPTFDLGVSKILDALRQLDHHRMPVFEERVAQALALALSTTTTTTT